MPKTLAYSLAVFAGGCCYGVMVPLVGTAHALGISTGDILVTQYLLSAFVFAVIVLVFSRRRIPLRTLPKLLGVGALASGVSFGYYNALALLPASAALTLLFQFVWMGAVLEAVLERKAPNGITLISIAVVLVGTFFAAGAFDMIMGGGGAALDPLGVFYGLLSAVFYTAFLFATGRVATDIPPVNRSLFYALGSLVVVFLMNPGYNPFVVLDTEFAIYGLALAVIGIVVPVFLISSGSPHIPASLTTVMASSELPSGIICAMIFLGDTISVAVGVGVAAVLIGIVIAQSKDLLGFIRSAPKGTQQ
jgi:drug/metabolite transporter (DMT)-like permease